MLITKKRNLKKVNKSSDKRFSLSNMVWIGFNYTCGMAFPLSFGTLIFGSSNSGVGLWIFLILALGSLLAAIMGYAYSKMSRFYIHSNGATYAYVRSSFGRFLGWIIGSLQYVGLPLTTVSLILSMISINFKDIVDWGSYTELYLNLIGIGVYLIASCIIFFGIKYFKIFINLSGFIKWFSTIFVVFAAIALAGVDNFSGFKEAITKTQEIKKDGQFFLNFNNAFLSMFYFYAGFETYTTIAKNVKNPSKTLPRSILYITILTFSFYIITTFFFICVDGNTIYPGESYKWFSDNPPLDIARQIAGTLGVVLVIASMIALKLNAAMQSGLYASGMLEPLAKEHYITPKFSRLNKDRIAISSVIFNIILTIFLTFILICLPILLVKGGSEPDYTNLIGFTTIIIFIQYILVLAAMFKLYFDKKIYLFAWEIIAFIIVIFFLVFELIIYFVNEILNIVKAYSVDSPSSDSKMNALFAIISLIIFFGLIAAVSLTYLFHYLPIYNKRIKNKPELQKELEKDFEISGYAGLEKKLLLKKITLLKDMKNKLKLDLKSIIKHDHKKQKNEFSIQKEQYLVKYNNELKDIKNTYKKNVKNINNFSENFESIDKIYSEYTNNYHELIDKRKKDLKYMRLNIVKIDSYKFDYLNSKHRLLNDIQNELEDFIMNSDDINNIKK